MFDRITFIIIATTVHLFLVDILSRVVERVQNMMHKLRLQRAYLEIKHIMISGDVVKIE